MSLCVWRVIDSSINNNNIIIRVIDAVQWFSLLFSFQEKRQTLLGEKKNIFNQFHTFSHEKGFFFSKILTEFSLTSRGFCSFAT